MLTARGPGVEASSTADQPEPGRLPPGFWANARCGVRRIQIGADRNLELLVEGLDRLRSVPAERRILACLTGAVVRRDSDLPPYFSGRSLAATMNLPLIAPADPTLSLAPDLTLGWYAGNEAAPDLPETLAEALDAAARAFDARLLIFGSSGGGFAALSLAALLRSPADIVVVNPQTSLRRYYRSPTSRYLEVAFPTLWRATAGQPTLDARIEAALDDSGIRHDLCRTAPAPGVRVLYLQNRSDRHRLEHTAPYVGRWRLSGVAPAAYRIKDGPAISLYLGDWGSGHQRLPRERVAPVLELVRREGASPEAAAILADGRGPFPAVTAAALDDPARPARLRVKVSYDGSVVRARCRILDEDDLRNVRFAYVLLADGARVATRPYTAADNALFEAVTGATELAVKAFARWPDGWRISAVARVGRHEADSS